MNFERTTVSGFEASLHGMRNPKNSWARSDSVFGLTCASDVCMENLQQVADKWAEKNPEHDNDYYYDYLVENGFVHSNPDGTVAEVAFIGPADMKLAQSLIGGGSEHRKFLRQINVSVDITAPLFVWKELDTYKIGTTADSCSTMHKLADTPITMDCFELDDYNPYLPIVADEDGTALWTVDNEVEALVEALEYLRNWYKETNDTRYWKELVRWLPESWLQTRTWSANYEVLRSICRQRKGHKLTEWEDFINWAHTLPYAEDFIFYQND